MTEILNIKSISHAVPLVTDWIFNEFIKDKIPNCSRQDILHAIENRKIDAIPMTFVAYIAGEAVGTISLFENDLQTMPDIGPWIAAVFVHPTRRGHGIAGQLVEHACNAARAIGVKTLYLRTETAQGLYEKLHWDKVCDTKDELSRDVSVYKKELQ